MERRLDYLNGSHLQSCSERKVIETSLYWEERGLTRKIQKEKSQNYSRVRICALLVYGKSRMKKKKNNSAICLIEKYRDSLCRVFLVFSVEIFF